MCRVNQPKMALKAATMGCSAFPSSPEVWEHRLQLELELCSRHKAPSSQLQGAVQTALQSVPKQDAPSIWLLALTMFNSVPQDVAKLQDALVAFLAGAARGPMTGGMGLVAAR